VIRIFIISGSLLTRSGLENVLKARAVKVVGTAANLESADSLLSDAEADAVLIDATGEQPEQFVQTVLESGLASELAVILLAEHLPRASSAAALRSGVRALLPSDVSEDQLIAALEAAASGLVVVHPADVEAAFPASAPASRPLPELAEPLTRREREVLQMLAAGLGNKEIAARLEISEHTVKFHVASILGKLGAESRTEAVSLGIRRGLVLL
jgi:two-component system, NarL family, response regulator YdfI